jgi:aromatic ring-opening dioxygenase LigB subunit
MLLHAAFIPHSPLLLPSVHAAHRGLLAPTVEAIEEVAKHLYVLAPDVLCVVSGHGEHYADAFSADMAPSYAADLHAFGDLSTPPNFAGAPALCDRLQRHLRQSRVPFTLSTNETLEYGTSVVLRLLAEKLPRARILPLAFSDLSRKDHFQFGQIIRDVFDETSERVVVVGSGDLSHALESTSPAGFAPEGKVFDDALVQAVSQGSASHLLTLSEEVVVRAHESGLRPLLVLFGLLEKTWYRTEVLSYQAPLGVGYLVAQFNLR